LHPFIITMPYVLCLPSREELERQVGDDATGEGGSGDTSLMGVDVTSVLASLIQAVNVSTFSRGFVFSFKQLYRLMRKKA